VFYEPRLLATKLAALGWQADIHPIGWRFFYVTARRAARRSWRARFAARALSSSERPTSSPDRGLRLGSAPAPAPARALSSRAECTESDRPPAGRRDIVRIVSKTEPGPHDGTVAWHRRLHHTGRDQLSEETAQTPGMRRYEAISGARNGSRKIWMGETRVAPGMISGDHHHGQAETGIYIVSGHPVFVFLERDVERRVETGPGDYVYVPPYVPHREENPSADEEAVVVLARSTQEGIVVNLASLRAEVPELDRLIADLASEERR
jgi:uncharacterized RmlC-like cupin family protein